MSTPNIFDFDSHWDKCIFTMIGRLYRYYLENIGPIASSTPIMLYSMLIISPMSTQPTSPNTVVTPSPSMSLSNRNHAMTSNLSNKPALIRLTERSCKQNNIKLSLIKFSNFLIHLFINREWRHAKHWRCDVVIHSNVRERSRTAATDDDQLVIRPNRRIDARQSAARSSNTSSIRHYEYAHDHDTNLYRYLMSITIYIKWANFFCSKKVTKANYIDSI